MRFFIITDFFMVNVYYMLVTVDKTKLYKRYSCNTYMIFIIAVKSDIFPNSKVILGFIFDIISFNYRKSSE